MRKYVTSGRAAFLAAGGFTAALLLGGAAYAVTDTVFRYSTPKTGWYGLSPMAFAPDNNTNANGYYIQYPGHLRLNNGNPSGCFGTGVNLPQGAKITAFAAWYESDTAASIDIYLFRIDVSNGSGNAIALGSSTDTSGTRVAMNIAVADQATATVNNQQYLYSAAVCLNDVDDRYHGGRIAYTYATAGD